MTDPDHEVGDTSAPVPSQASTKSEPAFIFPSDRPPAFSIKDALNESKNPASKIHTRLGDRTVPDKTHQGEKSPLQKQFRYYCWEHGCNGRLFTSRKVLLKHRDDTGSTGVSATPPHPSKPPSLEPLRLIVRDQQYYDAHSTTNPPKIGLGASNSNEGDDAFRNTQTGGTGHQELTEPTAAGFCKYIAGTFPHLASQHDFLLHRLSAQNVVRYTRLLAAKQHHSDLGIFCDSKEHCANSAKTHYPTYGPYDELGLADVPADIPSPPIRTTPATFECPYCFEVKTFLKPTEWTKHVLKDMQAFTCTFDDCREPRPFARRSDWVRHENEKHRRLDRWTCDVGDCSLTFYRRDIFLQHLIREHLFVEPKSKLNPPNKGEIGTTWQRVLDCEHRSDETPQEEPCKFCGKVSATWSELRAHLADHMTKMIPLVVLSLESTPEDGPSEVAPVENPPMNPPPYPALSEYSSPLAGSTWSSASPSRQPFLAQPSCPPPFLHAHEPRPKKPLIDQWEISGTRPDVSLIPVIRREESSATKPASEMQPTLTMGPTFDTTKYLEACRLCVKEDVWCDGATPCFNCSTRGLEQECRDTHDQSRQRDARPSESANADFAGFQTRLKSWRRSALRNSANDMDAEDLKKELEALEKATAAVESSGIPEGGDSSTNTTQLEHSSAVVDEEKLTELCASALYDDVSTAVPSRERTRMSRDFHVHTPIECIDTADASTQTVADETQRVDTDKMSEVLSDADVEMSSPRTTEKALSDAGSATSRLPPPSKMRQVGVAQVTVKLLSLFGGPEEEDPDGTDSEYDFDGWGVEECWDDGGGEGSAGNSGAIVTTEDSAPAVLVPSGTPAPRGRPPPGDEDEERRRKRPKKQSDRICSGPPQPRFACPYQAYDQARDCLKPSTRNRQGGCESIKRVKQHLARRHMVSSRCTRCWASMETRKKLEDHQRNAICPEVEKPTAECFMAEELESLVTQKPQDGGSDTATPEKSWWNLFKMLIPDMQEAEVCNLKLRYDPYYKPRTQVLATPALMFPDSWLPWPEFSANTPGEQATWNLDQPLGGFAQPTASNEAAMPSTFTTVLPEHLTRSLSVPVFAIDAPLPGASFAAPPEMAPAETSLDEFVSDIFDTSSPIIRTPTATTSRSSVSAYPAGTGDINSWADNTVTANPSPGAMQLQRDYDMLKLRNKQTELEFSELEEGRKAAREDVKAAQAILHEIMEMPAVQGAPYGRLLEMAGILIKAGGRLR